MKKANRHIAETGRGRQTSPLPFISDIDTGISVGGKACLALPRTRKTPDKPFIQNQINLSEYIFPQKFIFSEKVNFCIYHLSKVPINTSFQKLKAKKTPPF
jgi:hypothetical protein